MNKIYILNEYISSTKNGIGTYIQEFISCLQKIDISVCLVLFNADCDEFTILEKNGVEYIYFPEFKAKDYLDYPEVIGAFFKLYIQDSLETCFCINHFPSNKLIVSIRKSYPLSKIVFVAHNQIWTSAFFGDDAKFKRAFAGGWTSKKYSSSYKRMAGLIELEGEAYQMVDHIVCLTDSTRQLLLDVYQVPEKKIWLIPNGLECRNCSRKNISRNKLRMRYFIGEEELIIIYVGRLEETKGIYALLDAFKSVLKNYPKAKLVIAGSDIFHSFEHSDNSMATKVIYTGHLKASVLQQWYQMADIGVIPSYTEQCSCVGIEMMMHGLPIVASDGFGLRDMFKDGVNAIVAPIGKRTKKAKGFSENLARALTMLLSSETLRDKIGRNARETYVNYYSLRHMQEGYRRLFRAMDS